MSIFIILITIGIVVFLGLRDWLFSQHLTQRSAKRLLHHAQQHVALGEWQQAEKTLRLLYENGFTDIQTWILYAQILRGTGDLEEALRWVNYGLRKYSDQSSLRIEKGKILLAQSEWAEAVALLSPLHTLLQDEADLLALANAYFQLQDYEHSWQSIAPLCDTSKNRVLLEFAGDTLFALKRFIEAEKIYQKGVEQSEEEAKRTLHLKIARCLRYQGSLDKSSALYSYIIQENPRDMVARVELGAVLQERGAYQEALNIYKLEDAWMQRDLHRIAQAGVCALRLRNFSVAEICFAEVMALGSLSSRACSGLTHIELYTYYGYALECQKKWERAVKNYHKLCARFPECASGWRALAWIFGAGLTASITLEEGVRYAEKSIELQPDALSWEILSACQARAGNFSYAYEIQEYLFAAERDEKTKAMRQVAMRHLRNHLPLNDQQLSRALVA